MDFEIKKQVLEKCMGTDEEAAIPEGVREISSHAFSGCGNLRKVTIPDGVEKIDDYAFADSFSYVPIEELILPDSVEHLGINNITSGGYNKRPEDVLFKRIHFGKGLKTIGSNRLWIYSDLKPIEYISDLEYVFDEKYSGSKQEDACDILYSDFSLDAENPYFRYEDGFLLSKDGKTLVSCLIDGVEEVAVPNGVEKIMGNAFAHVCLGTLVIPGSVKEMKGTFVDARIDKVVLSEGISLIENQAFLRSHIKEVVFPHSLKKIEGFAFLDAYDFKTLRLYKGTECPGGLHFSPQAHTDFNELESIELLDEDGSTISRLGMPSPKESRSVKERYDYLIRSFVKNEGEAEWGLVQSIYTDLKNKTSKLRLLYVAILSEAYGDNELLQGINKYKKELSDMALENNDEKTKAKLDKLLADNKELFAPKKNKRTKEKNSRTIIKTMPKSGTGKTEVFETVVLYGSIEEINAVYKELEGQIELKARALGMACRSRGLDYVKALVKLGCTFKYQDKSYKYGSGFTTRSGYKAIADYSILLLDECKCQSSHGIFYGYDSGSSCSKYLSENWVNHVNNSGIPPIIPESERADIIEYLFEHRKKCGLDPSKLLYYSILSSSEFAISKLKELGVTIPKKEKAFITEGGRGYDFQDYLDSIYACKTPESLYQKLTHWISEIDESEKMALSGSAINDLAKLLFSDKVFSLTKDRIDISKVSKNKIIEQFILDEYIEGISNLAELGWLDDRRKRESSIEFANSNNKVNSLAWLIEFKKRTLDSIKEEEAILREEKKAFHVANPNSVAELKKVWSYKKLSDGTLQITKYKGTDTEVTVPEKIGKSPVSSFAATYRKMEWIGPFDGSNVKRVILPESIRIIGTATFKNCVDLESCIIPYGVKKIEDRAFYGCKSLMKIEIPDSVKSIGREAFSDSGISSLVLPRSVNEVGHGAFSRCNILQTATLSEGFHSSLDSMMFFASKSLREVTIPGSQKKMGSNMFDGCKMLELVDIGEGVEVIDGLNKCEALQTIVIPKSAKTIAPFAFYKSSNLRDVTVLGKETAPVEEVPAYLNYSGNPFDGCSVELIIHVPSGSKMEEFCKAYDIKYDYIDA